MGRLANVLREIIEVSSEIFNFYQEVYPFLKGETITLPTRDKDLVNEKYFRDYLESLREILHHHKLTHTSKGGEMTLT